MAHSAMASNSGKMDRGPVSFISLEKSRNSVCVCVCLTCVLGYFTTFLFITILMLFLKIYNFT